MLDLQIFLKIAERLDPLSRSFHLDTVEGIAFVQTEFASDDLVHRVRVAVDIDAFDEHARGFGNIKGDAHRQRFFVALELRVHIGERVTEKPGAFSQALDGVLDLFSIVPVAFLHRKIVGQRFGIEIADLAVDLYRAEFVTLPFLHHIGDDEVLLVGRQFGDRADHAEIGIALRQVELAQFLLVERQPVGIVACARAENAGQPRLLGDHFAAQLAVGKLLVADDVDLADLRFRPFIDFEDDIDAVLIELNQLGLDRCSKATLALVQLDDTGHVGAHLRTRIDLPRRELDFRLNLVVLQPLVPFQDDTVDDRVFAHFDGDIAVHVADADIGKQFGCVQVFQSLVGGGLCPGLARSQADVGTHGIRLEPLGASYRNRLNRFRRHCGLRSVGRRRLRKGRRRRQHSRRNGNGRHARKTQGNRSECHYTPTFHMAPQKIVAPLARMGAPDQVMSPAYPRPNSPNEARSLNVTMIMKPTSIANPARNAHSCTAGVAGRRRTASTP